MLVEPVLVVEVEDVPTDVEPEVEFVPTEVEPDVEFVPTEVEPDDELEVVPDEPEPLELVECVPVLVDADVDPVEVDVVVVEVDVLVEFVWLVVAVVPVLPVEPDVEVEVSLPLLQAARPRRLTASMELLNFIRLSFRMRGLIPANEGPYKE